MLCSTRIGFQPLQTEFAWLGRATACSKAAVCQHSQAVGYTLSLFETWVDSMAAVSLYERMRRLLLPGGLKHHARFALLHLISCTDMACGKANKCPAPRMHKSTPPSKSELLDTGHAHIKNA